MLLAQLSELREEKKIQNILKHGSTKHHADFILKVFLLLPFFSEAISTLIIEKQCLNEYEEVL